MPEIKPIQKILFGSPGTGKSYKIREIARDKLKIPFDDPNRTVKTVFHPEYTYADFMGKLLPLTQGNSIIYKFYPGHFIRILGMAYQGLIEGNNDHYLLVIDELNRGNAAAIFGTVFQLLDRETNGWSSYGVDISEMELVGLLEVMNQEPSIDNNGVIYVKDGTGKKPYKDFFKKEKEETWNLYMFDKSKLFWLLEYRRINIPPNLSILATINTSDESIYYLDSAFKRRWDWEYVKAPVGVCNEESIPEELRYVKLVIDGKEQGSWSRYIVGINELIKSNYQVIRRIEDKQIGWWFIKPENGQVDLSQVKDKLMFYLWDSVFARDKKPLEDELDLTKKQVKLTSYSDFIDRVEDFMMKVHDRGQKSFDASSDR